MDFTDIEISKIELDLDKGEHSVALPINTNPGDLDQDILLLVERTDGDTPDGISCEVQGAGVDQISTVRSVATYVGRVANDAKKLTVRLWTSGRQRIRITLVRFRKIAVAAGKRIVCNTCKLLVEALTIAALSAIGVHIVAGATVVLSAAQVAAINGLLAHGGALGKLILKYGVQHIWSCLVSTMTVVNKALALTDAFCENVCRTATFCP